MELQQLITFPFIFTSLVLFIFVLKQLNKPKISNKSSLLPPGPSKLPLIGHIHHLLGLPHHKLRDLAKKHGPLLCLQLGQVSAVVVSSPGVAKQMLKTHDLLFSDRPLIMATKILTYGGRDLVMAPYGEFWRQLRKLFIIELLSAKRVQSFWSVREEEVMNLVQNTSLMAGSPINLSSKFYILSNDITTRTSFGKKCKDKKVFISLLQEVASLASGFAIADLFPSLKFLGAVTGLKHKIENIHQQLDQILDRIITEHAVKETEQGVEEDLVDVLLRLQKDGGLGFSITTENIKALLLDISMGGSETSSSLMVWTFSELLRNPRVMNKVQAEVRQVFNGKSRIEQADVNQLSYLGLVIKEALRLHPPAPLLLPRECRETCEIDGYEIPKGTKVIVNAWAMARDPDNWKDPDKFEPERFQDMSIDYKGTNFAYIPFGAGRRMCPGISFGMANVELPLAMLLYHFDWQIGNQVKPEELDMTEAYGAAAPRKYDLYVVPTRYNPQETD